MQLKDLERERDELNDQIYEKDKIIEEKDVMNEELKKDLSELRNKPSDEATIREL